jgi:hypothetical protein
VGRYVFKLKIKRVDIFLQNQPKTYFCLFYEKGTFCSIPTWEDNFVYLRSYILSFFSK